MTEDHRWPPERWAYRVEVLGRFVHAEEYKHWHETERQGWQCVPGHLAAEAVDDGLMGLFGYIDAIRDAVMPIERLTYPASRFESGWDYEARRCVRCNMLVEFIGGRPAMHETLSGESIPYRSEYVHATWCEVGQAFAKKFEVPTG